MTKENMKEKYSELIDIYVEFKDKRLKEKLYEAYKEGYINDLKDHICLIEHDTGTLSNIIAQVGKRIEQELDVNQWERGQLPYFDTPIVEEDNNATR